MSNALRWLIKIWSRFKYLRLNPLWIISSLWKVLLMRINPQGVIHKKNCKLQFKMERKIEPFINNRITGSRKLHVPHP